MSLKSIYIIRPWKEYSTTSKVNVREELSQKNKLLHLRNSIYRPTYVKYLMKEELYFLHLTKFKDKN